MNISNNEGAITVQILGAAGTVTGSKYLVKTGEIDVLVDCGMFQGLKSLRQLNWEPLQAEPSKIDVVLLTHGHLDHTGYLPCLVRDGFNGPICATAPTIEVAKVILHDSARIQEEDAQRANEEGYTKHHPAKPLYGLKDVERTIPHFTPRPLDQWIPLSDHVACRFRYNGHIIGATFIELKAFDKLLVFSGDIGRNSDILMFPPQKPEEADLLFIESTYGNRLHAENPEEHLTAVINDTLQRKGTLIIPGFAVERIQLLMYLVLKLKKEGKIPTVPVYTDSPMGSNVLDLFQQFPKWHKLSAADCDEMSKEIKLVKTPNETLQVAADKQPKIVIAGSGMASGGRVLTYFKRYLGNPSATILLAGYQAEGTRGRQLLEGAREIKLYGKYYKVKAKIEQLQGVSAHADQNGLIDWMSLLKSQPEAIYITHGEPASAESLKVKIKEVYGWEANVPALNEHISMSRLVSA